MSCRPNYDPCLDGKLNQIGSYAAAARSSAQNSAASAEQSEDYSQASAFSASQSATSATNAANSATQANNYLTQVTNIFENFDERYLGSKNAPPTTDNQGNPLQEGAMYWNSVSNGLFVWDGSVWVALPTGFDEFTNFLATATTTSRNLVTRFSEIVNVKDFGAVGDGVADDTAAIQNAFNTGKSIFFPDGSYKITSNLLLNSDNQQITLSKKSVLIKSFSGNHLITIDANNVYIFSGQFNGNNSSFPAGLVEACIRIIGNYNTIDSGYYFSCGRGITINGGDLSPLKGIGNIVKNCHVRDINGIGVCSSNSKELLVDKCHIYNCGQEGITYDNNTIKSVASSNVLINNGLIGAAGAIGAGWDSHNNIFNANVIQSQVTGSGIAIGGNLNIISNNNIKGTPFYGININSTPITTSSDNIIVGNVLEDNAFGSITIAADTYRTVVLKNSGWEIVNDLGQFTNVFGERVSIYETNAGLDSSFTYPNTFYDIWNNTKRINFGYTSAASTIGGLSKNTENKNILSAMVKFYSLSDTAGSEHGQISLAAKSSSSPAWNRELVRCFGNTGVVDFPLISTTVNAANAFLDSGSSNSLLRSSSSIKYKKDIEPIEEGYSEKVLDLQPVWYRSKCEADNSEWSYWGLIAEEVEKIDPRLVNYGYDSEDYELVEINDESGYQKSEWKLKADAVKKPTGVQYDRVPILLLDVVKKQQAKIEELTTRLEVLESK
jgi:hypothetical protein